MNKRKKAKLANKGWKVGTAAEFLDLSAEESAYIEMKLALMLSVAQQGPPTTRSRVATAGTVCVERNALH